ncbi:MAG: hypothetical protein A3B70_01805 [Deltaproteobacteria bacterium RIFCSPHIGHO2_02_FULL_40_11]|nr:MAG: hypothetical protein A3B70_01805 [Deltaproteobacteria bacterium RIFCSPHIGHO2_02_FULL_40_11]
MRSFFKSKKFLLVAVALSGLILGIALRGLFEPSVEANKTPPNHYQKIGILLKVLNFVESNYVEEVEIKELVYGAIKGMLATLDPHTNFLTPELFKEMKVDTSGEFGGLGIEITMKDGVLTIITPLEGTPADKAGLKANDKIIKIEDEYTDKMNLMEAVSKMRGKKGTPIQITILREGLTEPKEFKVVRDIIKVKSVKFEMLKEDIGYVRVANFQERTHQDLRSALTQLDRQSKKYQSKTDQPQLGLQGLVLDLRNNPGGLLDQAVKVSDLFLEKGIIVSTMGRLKENKDVEYAHKSGTWRDVPIVVLVNGASASASEIVGGALQDHQRALLIGTKTFGKGSVQQVIELDDQSGLKLTIAKYYTPSGRSIQESGLEPDIEVEQRDPKVLKEEAEKLKTQKSRFREEDLPQHIKNGKKKEEVKKEEFPQSEAVQFDHQLQQAIGYLRSYEIFKKMYQPKNKQVSKK